MAYKFIRAIEYVPTASSHPLSAFFKLLYETWCYCVNGGSSPTTPGGLAATTPSTLPTNFLEGTSVLATGTDGVTVAGSSQIFSSASASFTTAMIGKHLVAWKPGSGSSDDSIYMIRARPSATTLVIEARNGGTPDSVTRRPVLTTRSGIVYRVVDLTSTLGLISDGQYMVLQMDSSGVNAGQANPQFQFIRRASGLSLGMVASPAGTWNGSAFTDGTTEVTGAWFAGGSTTTAYMTIIADNATILMHMVGGFGGGAIHIEVPTRMYTLAQDPNPVCFLVTAATGSTMFTTANTGAGYGGALRMVGTDGVARACRTLVRSLAGDGQTAENDTIPGTLMVDPGPSLNVLTGKAMSSEVLCSTMAVGQYALARAKLRAVRFAGAYYPNFMRFGDAGEWIHTTAGIYWPWDNSVLPFNLFPIGF